MLLRGSGRHTGDDYDLSAILGDGAAGGGVAAGAALAAYADAFFNAVVRIADATGIPLEEAKAELSADLRGDLGLDDWSAAQSG